MNVPNDKPVTFAIHIDRAEFKVSSGSMTGVQLRALPSPPIDANYDLYLKVPGPQDDQVIANDQVVTLSNGMHFVTAPSKVTAGRGDC